MSIPWALPEWLPWWAVTLAMAPVLIYALLFLMMPFNVFGVKDRLDLLESRLDELQNDIRQLSLRLRDAEAPDPDERYAPPARAAEPPRTASAPRLAASRAEAERAYDHADPPRAASRRAGERPVRSEPRLDRPR